MTVTATKPNTTQANPFTNATAATETFTKGMNETYKAAVDANQKVFNTLAGSWNTQTTKFPFADVTFPAMIEKTTRMIEGMVEANTKFATEMNHLAVESAKNNLKTFKRTGELAAAQFSGKEIKAETAREIWDEAMGFATTAGERLMKLNTEHNQRVAQIIDEALPVKTVR